MDTEKKPQGPNSPPEAEGSEALPVPVHHKVTAVIESGAKRQSTNTNPETEEPPTLTIIPVRNAVLFPQNVIPFVGGRDLSLESVERAARQGGSVGIVTQRDARLESPGIGDLFDVGTEARIAKVLRLPDGTFGMIAQGIRRFRIINEASNDDSGLAARVEFYNEETSLPETLEMTALGKGLKQLVQQAIALSPSIPNEVGIFIENVQDPVYLANIIIPYLGLAISVKQEVLEISDASDRIRRIHFHLAREIEILEMSHRIHSDVRSEMNKQQRGYYVREQLKLLQKELSEMEGSRTNATGNDPLDFSLRIEQSAMPKEAREAALREVDRLKSMQTSSPEYTVSHTYVTWLLDLPWGQHTQRSIDLVEARSILDADHHGLEKIKRRILEFLAVYALRSSLNGPILLFVGPPGVGKTSLGQSIAKALGRKFARISLGGVRDEADVRGHRRTYIGSMPGRIIDSLKKAGSMDPVLLLDEVDKLSSDHRGDPSSALLELLDSEQNHAFVDHYLNVPIDLSRVLFICTANDISSIPAPLKDRMEVIELPGYTFLEKSAIAFDHLLPKVIEEHGLSEHARLQISPEMMKTIISGYTREAGVRQLRRELAAVARTVACEVVERRPPGAPGFGKRKMRRLVDKKLLDEALGPVKFLNTKKPEQLKPGVATGLAYTPVGGDVLFVESVVSEGGTGRIAITGQLGDVMRESVETAFSFIRSNATAYGVKTTDFQKRDFHVHFPEGAVRKDGPSAGVAIFLALTSLLRNSPLPSDLAATGEISLRGEVLPVGGIKEKLLAAHRHGVRCVLLPRANEKDLPSLPAEVRNDMTILPVSTMDEVFRIAYSSRVSKGSTLKKGKKERMR